MRLLSELPTAADKGYDFTCVSSFIWTVPKATPKDIQKKLEKALFKSFENPTVKEIIKKWNMAYDPLDAQTLTNLIATDNKRFGEFAQKLGIGIYKK